MTPTPICDCHMHLSTQSISDRMLEMIPKEALMGMEMKENTADDLIRLLDTAGIEKAFALSNAYTWGMDMLQMGTDELDMVRMENDFTVEQTSKYPDRLVSFFSINPLKDYALNEMERCIKELKMPGLKMHFTNSGVNLLDPEHKEKVEAVFQFAARNNTPALIHFPSRLPTFGKPDIEVFVNDIVAKIPDLKIQMAHVGHWGGFNEKTSDIFGHFIHEIENNPNISKDRFFFDISAVIVNKTVGPLTPPTEEQLNQFLDQNRKYGLEYIMFGSDYFAATPQEYLKVIFEKVTYREEELSTIFKNDGNVLFT